MTILAGIISLNLQAPISDSACEAIRQAISRDPSDQPIVFNNAQAFLAKVDIGAFRQPARRVSSAGTFSMLVGEPLLTCKEAACLERDGQLEFLHNQWDRGNFDGLRTASGTFCAIHHDPGSGTAQLITDRLGLRPLYYVIHKDFLYFSSALRVLEAIQDVPKKMDVTAAMETVGFGYPFSGRTPYADIKVLQACEVVTVQRGRASSSRYFRWDLIPPSRASEEAELKETHYRFQAAVRRRLKGDKTTFAYLSGGLDSRCTVAALRAEGAQVATYNFSLPDTQDQLFGLEFARKIGAVHHEVPTEPGPNWSVVMADAWRTSVEWIKKTECPHLAWTGEGGSVGLGHVYLSPEIVESLYRGDRDGAIEIFLRQQKKGILTRILNPKIAAQFGGHLQSRLRKELDDIRYPDPVRAFHIFLNLNGPHHHLKQHFETIDQHRLEFQLPFYDSEFLEHITGIEARPCLYHEFYVKWLSFFNPAVLAVPWQAYAGHVPSPVSVPEDLPDQWTAPASRSHEQAARNNLLKVSAAMLSASDFPDPLLDKKQLKLMWWATKLRLGDYGYALRAALTYYQYWQTTNGNYEL